MAFMGKIFQALRQTRESVSDAFESVIKQKVTPESLDELENTLISADMGFATVETVTSTETWSENPLQIWCAKCAK